MQPKIQITIININHNRFLIVHKASHLGFLSIILRMQSPSFESYQHQLKYTKYMEVVYYGLLRVRSIMHRPDTLRKDNKSQMEFSEQKSHRIKNYLLRSTFYSRFETL